MATQTLRQMRFLKNMFGISRVQRGGVEEQGYFCEGASQSWEAGDLIYLASDGYLKAAVDTSGAEIAGIAQQAATGTTGEPVRFWPIRASDLFLMQAYHSTAASAVTALTDVSSRKRIILSSGNCYVDYENTTLESTTATYPTVTVMGIATATDRDGAALGDIYGYVYATFNRLALAEDGLPQTRVLQFDQA